MGEVMRHLLLLSTVALLGCPNTDAAVFVAPSLAAPQAAVKSEGFGLSLTGAVTLNLHLGARASGPSEVDIGQFELMDAEQKGAIVTPLPVQAETSFPVEVVPDKDVSIRFTFDSGKTPLDEELEDELCDPKGVVVKGVIEDSLLDQPTPVFSGVFHVSGC
jgi:hypothetical protein